MPTSRSPSRSTSAASRPPAPSTRTRPALIWIALAALLVIAALVLACLPASMAARFSPPALVLSDFSGTLWHGSAGQIAWSGRNAGAVEWRLHPQGLLTLTLDADVHWVKASCVLDTRVMATRKGVSFRDAHGSGAIEDLGDLGVQPGWKGSVTVDLPRLESDYARLVAVEGSVHVEGIASPQVAGGAPLGSYELTLPSGAIDATGTLTGRLSDTGGPLELQAQIRYSSADHTGLLSGTLRERAGASPALHQQIDGLAQLRPRDAEGRIPVDLEFRL